MPCLEISMPRVDRSTKEKLAAKLTSVFEKVSGHPAQIFGIVFHEYEPGSAASGGKLCDGGPDRPYLHFLLYGPRLKKSVKREIVKQFTDTFCECVGHADWKPVIHIGEYPYDNVGVNGELLSESYQELSSKRFYYEITDE